MFKGYGQRKYEHRECFIIPSTFGYTGHRFDREHNYFYAKYRYYTPTTQRWLSCDPLGMVVGANFYACVRGRVVHDVYIEFNKN